MIDPVLKEVLTDLQPLITGRDGVEVLMESGELRKGRHTVTIEAPAMTGKAPWVLRVREAYDRLIEMGSTP